MKALSPIALIAEKNGGFLPNVAVRNPISL